MKKKYSIRDNKEPQVKHYVVGFMFSPDGRRVVLIEKKKPEWQAGLLNGVGGLVEPFESPYSAMVREFAEETGVTHPDWLNFGCMTGGDWRVHIYAVASDKFSCVRTATDEHVRHYRVSELRSYLCVPNLPWLVPMAQHVALRKMWLPSPYTVNLTLS